MCHFNKAIDNCVSIITILVSGLFIAILSGQALAISNFEGVPAVDRETQYMTTLHINDVSLVGSQYWNVLGNMPFHYPDDVVWGFYPEDATPDVIKCAEASFAKLKLYMESGWADMNRAVSQGASNEIYLWTNDYSYASKSRQTRSARFWHSQGLTGDLAVGSWIWESTLTVDGTCTIPDDVQIAEYFSHVMVGR